LLEGEKVMWTRSPWGPIEEGALCRIGALQQMLGRMGRDDQAKIPGWTWILARQGRRVLQDPSPRSARILQAVHFPSTDFLEAREGAGPSHIWRAIVEGKEIVKLALA
jgi:hypothetical protein